MTMSSPSTSQSNRPPNPQYDPKIQELAFIMEEMRRRGLKPKVTNRGRNKSGQYLLFQRTYRHDLVAFANDCIRWREGERLTFYQEDAFSSLNIHNRVAVYGPRGLGKTALNSIAIWWGLLTVDDVKIPITAGAFRQLEKYLWPEVHKWCGLIRWDRVGLEPPTPKDQLLTTDIRLTPTSLTVTASPKDPGKFEGAHARDRVLCVFDESKEVSDEMFDSAEGAFSKVDEPLALATSTPGMPMGRFYDICSHKPGYEDWHVIPVTMEDMIKAGRLDPAWVESRRKQWGENNARYINHVLGRFAQDDPAVIIPHHWIEASMERWSEMKDTLGIPTKPTSVGVDCAWGGDDKTTIALAHGRTVIDVKEFYHRDTMETVGHVIRMVNWDKTIPITVDVIGWGAGVYDRLKEQGYSVVAFNAGSKSRMATRHGNDDTEFMNNRAASWNEMREILDPTGIDPILLPDVGSLVSELSTPKWKPTSTGKMQVEGKNDIRKRLSGRSTDYADAVIMALIGEKLSSYGSGTQVSEIDFPIRGVD